VKFVGCAIGTELLPLTWLRNVLVQFPGAFPALRVNPQYRRRAICQVDETAVIADSAVAEQWGQQSQAVLSGGDFASGPWFSFASTTVRLRKCSVSLPLL